MSKNFWEEIQTKRLISILMIMCVIVSTLVFSQVPVGAVTFNDINQSSVFVKQQVKGTCTLASSVMLVRRAAIMAGNNNWAAITELTMKSTAWINNVGLSWNFTYSGITVNHGTLPGGSSNTSALINLLANHPEGIVAYNGGNANQRHAVLITDYTNGTFYCADPAGSSSGRVPLVNSTIKGTGQNGKVANFNAYWYVTTPLTALTPLNHNHAYTLVWTESAHPHRNVYKCPCGATYVNANSVNYSDKCTTCKTPVIDDGWYKIALAQNTNYVVSVSNGDVKDGQNVQLMKYNKTSNEQKLFFRHVGNGFYTIQFYHSKKMLDVNGGIGNSGTNVQQWKPNGSNGQQWVLLSDGKGSYYLKSKSGNVVLDLYSNKIANSTNLWVYNQNYSVAQKWNLISAGKKIKFDANGGVKEIHKVSTTASGVNISRAKDQMVVYNKSGCTTGTNVYGVEVIVDQNNRVTEIKSLGNGNALVPNEGGFVLSGHDKMRTWITKNIRVGDYVIYNNKNYKITVYKDYNSYHLQKTFVIDNQKIGYLPSVKREGFAFEGWHTSKVGGTKVTSDTVSPNKTLYAHWKSIHKHKIVLKNEKRATYLSTGYSGDKVCSICGEITHHGKITQKLKLKTPTVKYMASKKSLTVKVGYVKGATGYQVRYIFKGKTVTKTYHSMTKVTKTIKKLKKGKYKVSVRAFVKSGNVKAFGNWSKTKTLKVK